MKFNKTKLFELKKALLQLAEIATEEGVTLIAEKDMEVGIEVFVQGDEGLVPASDGTYTYNGQTITVEGGVVKAIEETRTEENEPETPAEANTEMENNEEQTEENEPETPAEASETNAEVDRLKALVDDLTSRLETANARIAELEEKLKEPVADSVDDEFKKTEKETSGKQDYAAAMRKAREIRAARKNK